jgi:hypothetical protein
MWQQQRRTHCRCSSSAASRIAAAFALLARSSAAAEAAATTAAASAAAFASSVAFAVAAEAAASCAPPRQKHGDIGSKASPQPRPHTAAAFAAASSAAAFSAAARAAAAASCASAPTRGVNTNAGHVTPLKCATRQHTSCPIHTHTHIHTHMHTPLRPSPPPHQPLLSLRRLGQPPQRPARAHPNEALKQTRTVHSVTIQCVTRQHIASCARTYRCRLVSRCLASPCLCRHVLSCGARTVRHGAHSSNAHKYLFLNTLLSGDSARRRNRCRWHCR